MLIIEVGYTSMSSINYPCQPMQINPPTPTLFFTIQNLIRPRINPQQIIDDSDLYGQMKLSLRRICIIICTYESFRQRANSRSFDTTSPKPSYYPPHIKKDIEYVQIS
ncbi:hypothetical protein A2775_00325 [Candidatus Curtissbacteria bacterium RIFCSPHIGHO2_01_FULL_39_57]|nr:MAG: hypothetical protein A2775_00325 [Candidatus Curtissbacteria bacterium RIFCSPHIGHO2_01_FULL_39_57]OGD90135.1 MAG: hypothetical protein A3E11_00045 [Candidatus Curtissbacteria bacterium RIFCSPHIGHO2_12_FULL_38_37]